MNNLDLNGDGQVDYLRVVDSQKDNIHSIIIQVPVSKSETQDVAVIHVEKKGNDKAQLQIIGDETLYGKNYIVEPGEETKKNTPLENKKKKEYKDDDVYATKNEKGTENTKTEKKSESETEPEKTTEIINVYSWPSVTYLYSRGYTVWVSPYYWGYYPAWYSPWAPYPWYMYHANVLGYYPYIPCRYGYYYYSPAAHEMYYGKRATSGYVEKTAAPYHERRGSDGIKQNRGASEQKNNSESQPRKSRNSNKVDNNQQPERQKTRQQHPNTDRQPSPQISPQPGTNRGTKINPR